MINTSRIGASIAAVLLTATACSGPAGIATSSPPGSVAASQPTQVQSKALLYVDSAKGGGFYAYGLPDRQPLCAQTGHNNAFDYSIAVDAAGNLWMPQVFDEGVNVTWFPPGCGSSGGTLSVPGGYVPEAIVFGSDGTKYVLSWGSGSIVSLYSGSSTSPTGELSDPRINTRAFAIGIDAEQNVYVSCCDDKVRNHRHGIYMIVFKSGGGTDRGKRLNLAQLGIPGGSILFDRAQNMIVPDQQYATVNVYAPPYTGSPAVYPLKGIPAQCALDPQQTTLACASGEPFFPGLRSAHRDVVPGVDTVDVYAYPSLRFRYSLKNRFGNTYSVVGVAFAPFSQQ